MNVEDNLISSSPDKLKKRVLFVITQSEFGGAQHFLYQFVSNLDLSKYEFLIAIGAAGNKEFVEAIRNKGIPHISLKNLKREISPLSDIKAIFEIKKLIKSFAPETVFLNSSKAGFIGSYAAVTSGLDGLRVIYRIGGWTFNDPWPLWKKWLWILLEKISAKWKDIIIVNNSSDLEQAKRLRIRPRQKLILAYNGLDVYKISFLEKEEARLKLFEKTSKYAGKVFQAKIIIGTIANLYPTKGVEYLVRVAEYFKDNEDITFMVIGDGTERNKIEEAIIEKGLDKKILLLGQIPQAHTFLKAFDVFVLPSLKEGFPWALIEAMAAKLPVIGTRVGAIPEIIEDGKNGFIVAPKDSEAIADKIREIIANDHLSKELGIQAHQTVLFKFELSKMVEDIESLL